MSHSSALTKRGTLRVAELYASRQGEGLLTGTDSVFIRISGCNLRCWFCDTPHASWNPEGDQRTVDDIVGATLELNCQHVVVTGGEPMLFPDVVLLCDQLACAGKHITMETAGTVMQDLTCDLMSISPKLSASRPHDGSISTKWQQQHDRRRWQPDVIRQLVARAKQTQLKFVVDTQSDFGEVQAMFEALRPDILASQVWIMPQSRTAAELDQHQSWLGPWCDEHGYRYCDRKQLRWYGNQRGT